MCASDIHFQKPTSSKEVCLYVQKCVGMALCIRKKEVERTLTISLGGSSLETSSIATVLFSMVKNRDFKAFFKVDIAVLWAKYVLTQRCYLQVCWK